MKKRFLLLFDIQSNPKYVNPNYITSIEQQGVKTFVHLPTHSFETNTKAETIYQEILNFDVANSTEE